MHIAYWSPAWPLEKFQNGIITYVHWIKRELERRGHRVSIFTEGEEFSVHHPHIHYVRRRLSDRALGRLSRMWQPAEFNVFDYSAVIAAAISATHRRDPIDIIEMEESFGWFADIERRTRLPLVVKLHGPAFLTLPTNERDTPFGREKIAREERALRTATAIISPSISTLEKTIEQYQLGPKEARQIVNPIGLDSEVPLWSLRTCERNTILYVGRFDKIKGADVLLDAFALILKSHPDSRLIFVGPDFGMPGMDGKHLQFEAYCALHFPPGFRRSVDFRGRLSIQEITTLRTRAMLTVAASRSENQPYAVLEAMLQGCPVVSTDAGGCPEIIASGETGLLAKSEDANDFARQILQIMEHPEHAAVLGLAARRHVIDNYAPAKVADSAIEMYKKVIAGYR
jgi:glycosyltransferase involved in cell wall biosynthesis